MLAFVLKLKLFAMMRLLNTLLLLFLVAEIKSAVQSGGQANLNFGTIRQPNFCVQGNWNYGRQGNWNYGNCRKFTIYKKDYPCDATKIKCYTDGEEIKFNFTTNKMIYYSDKFSHSASTFLILPDFGQNNKSDDIVDLVSAFHKKYNSGRKRLINTVVCDYDSLINGNYFKESEKNLFYIGKCIGQMMNHLVEAGMYIIGNGIGAPLMTPVAHSYNRSKPIRVIAQDPKGIVFGETDNDLISFEKNNISYFSECYHTNGNKYGFKCGAADWYYNLDDKIQPGCENGTELEQKQCSHDRMIKYYTESVRNFDAFFGFKCDYVKPNFDKKCPNVDAKYRSGRKSGVSDPGQFQVNTRAEYPYGLGIYINNTREGWNGDLWKIDDNPQTK